MVEQIQEENSFIEIGTRLNEVEQKQKLLKDRVLLIGENLISSREDSIKFESDIKNQIKGLNLEIQGIKRILNRIINEIPNLARKSEVEILEKQFKMFQPLEFARIKDVEEMIKKK
jgi:hypothetical protein